MITAEFVNDAISKVVERFKEDRYVCYTYSEIIEDEDGDDYHEINFRIDNEVIILLDALGIQHRVEMVNTYEGIGLDTYCLCVSYLLNGEICTYNLAVEQH